MSKKVRIRHFITGEWVEREALPGGRNVLARVGPADIKPVRQAAIRGDKPWVGKAMGVMPGDADSHNKEILDAGISGAYYDKKTGYLHCESRQARKREMQRRGYYDKDGGYGDAMPKNL